MCVCRLSCRIIQTKLPPWSCREQISLFFSFINFVLCSCLRQSKSPAFRCSSQRHSVDHRKCAWSLSHQHHAGRSLIITDLSNNAIVFRASCVRVFVAIRCVNSRVLLRMPFHFRWTVTSFHSSESTFISILGDILDIWSARLLTNLLSFFSFRLSITTHEWMHALLTKLPELDCPLHRERDCEHTQ